MEAKQKKVLIICAAVFVGSYVVRTAGNYMAYRAYVRRQEAVAAWQKARQEALKKTAEAKRKAEEEKKQAMTPSTVPPAPPPIPEPPPDPVFQAMRGHWIGGTAISSRGTFQLDLQLEDAAQPGQYEANLQLRYIGPLPRHKTAPEQLILRRMDPEAAKLTGSPENGLLKLTLTHKLGTLQGCAVSGATITPFGPNRIHVSWTEDKCGGGSVFARKLRI